MSCLEPYTIEVEINLEEWHDFETWYESREGQSSLVQICRVINYILGIYNRPLIVYPRIGSDTTDTVLSGINYNATPSINPLQDYKLLLIKCVSAVRDLLSTNRPDLDCVITYPNDQSTLLAAFNAAVASLNTSNKEDWKQYITAIRNALQGISISDIYIPGMSSATYNMLSYIWLGTPLTTFYQGLNDPSCIEEGGAGVEGYIRWYVAYGLPDELGRNNYSPLRDPFCGKIHTVSSPYETGVYAGFDVGDLWGIGGTVGGTVGVAPNRYGVVTWGIPYPEGTSFCDTLEGGNGASPLGWYEARTFVRTVRIRRTSNPEYMAATDGFLVEWHVEPSNPDISVSFSPASGSFNWASGQSYVDIEITTNLVDANIPANTYPIAGGKCSAVLIIDTGYYTVCIDQCGNLHNPLE